MRVSRKAMSMAAAVLAWSAGAARAQAPAGSFEAAYVEAPSTEAAGLARRLNAYAAGLRREPGPGSVEVLRELGRPNRMLVLEHWPALDDAAAAHREADLEAAAGNLQAPADFRRNGLLIVQIPATRPLHTFHVVVHLDVMPDGAAMASAAIQTMGASILAAPGGLGFEAGPQDKHPNHFTIHEVWASRAAYETYAATTAGQALRRQLAPVKGALYDDRFYVEAR